MASAALALAASSAVAGQDAIARNGARPGQAASSGSDAAAAFRGDYDRLLDHYAAVFEKLGNARGLKLVTEARQGLRAVSDEQLARVFARTQVPDLAPAVEAAERLDSATPERGAAASDGPRTPGFPNAPPILAACDVIPHDPGFTLGALIAYHVVRSILAAAEFACLQTVVVLGEGGNTAAVCIPLAIAQDLAAVPWDLADFCGGEEDSALAQGSYDRLDHIHTDLEGARADIIANDNANRDLIIANDNANRDILIGELRRLSCDLMRLSATPLGQRASDNPSCAGQPQFPYNFPEHP